MNRVQSAWLLWMACSVVAAVVTAYAAAFVMPNLEAAIVAFGVGAAWSALTPWTLRRVGRWAR